jgi:hypothetical protein
VLKHGNGKIHGWNTIPTLPYSKPIFPISFEDQTRWKRRDSLDPEGRTPQEFVKDHQQAGIF